MEYKGYTASVEYDDEAGILYGRVLHLRDAIDFQAESVADLKQEFHSSVDGYLAWCAESGDEPDKPFSGKFVVRLDPSTHRDAAIAAASAGKSLNDWIKGAVEAGLNVGSATTKRSKSPVVITPGIIRPRNLREVPTLCLYELKYPGSTNLETDPWSEFKKVTSYGMKQHLGNTKRPVGICAILIRSSDDDLKSVIERLGHTEPESTKPAVAEPISGAHHRLISFEDE